MGQSFRNSGADTSRTAGYQSNLTAHFVLQIRQVRKENDARLLARSATSAGTRYTFWSKAGVNRITTTNVTGEYFVSDGLFFHIIARCHGASYVAPEYDKNEFIDWIIF